MREVPLGDFLVPARDAEPLLPDEQYQTAGVLNRGRGLFSRPVVRGREVTYAQYYRLRTGLFVYSRLFVWEGALTVVEPEFDGHYVSPEFPTFLVERRLASPGYVSILCRWPVLWDRIRSMETGMGGRRKRVYPEALLTVRVPLPSLAEQRRIVDLVAYADRLGSAQQVMQVAGGQLRRGLLGTLLSERPGWERAPIGDLAEVVAGSTPSTRELGYWGGGIPWITPTEVSRQEGERITATVRTITEAGLRSIRSPILPTDAVLLTSRATVGAVALAGVPMAINQGFAALVAGPKVLPEWLMFWCQTNRHVFEALAGGSTFPEVSRANVRSVVVSVPPLEEQRRTVRLVGQLDDTRRALRRAATALSTLKQALVADLLSGEHQIPDPYDRLLNDVA